MSQRLPIPLVITFSNLSSKGVSSKKNILLTTISGSDKRYWHLAQMEAKKAESRDIGCGLASNGRTSKVSKLSTVLQPDYKALKSCLKRKVWAAWIVSLSMWIPTSTLSVTCSSIVIRLTFLIPKVSLKDS
ncbi:MAG: hypothetical protein QW279_12235 [Candidatus Jordarchaeaceae archaeon]